MQKLGIILGAAIALLLASIVGAVALVGGGSFDVGGTFTLISADGCSTSGTGYSDISDGAQVTIRDSKGEVLASGDLRNGTEVEGMFCEFDFSIRDVPEADRDMYSIEVSHRGEIEFKKAEAHKLGLSLGDVGDLY